MDLFEHYDINTDEHLGPYRPKRVPCPAARDLFLPGAEAEGSDHFDDDWFRYYPDGTMEVHELCGGCESDGSCPFHPPGCECSSGLCRQHLNG